MIQKRIAVSILVPVILLLVAATTAAQDSSLRTQTTEQGFSGIFTTEDKRQIFVEFRSQSPESFSSRVETLAGELLAETVRNNDVVTVTLKDVSVAFYLDAARRLKSASLSPQDRQRLRDYRQSDDFTTVRKLITELIIQGQVKKEQLKGFVAISMVLGDGPGSPKGSQAKAMCPIPNATQAFSFAGQAKESKSPGTKAAPDQCFGCCGAACWGCTGCWTGACAAHDQCVTDRQDHFHPDCMAILPEAIASLILECGLAT